MCFQCFISYFLGVLSMLFVLTAKGGFANGLILGIILMCGFIAAQLICNYIHTYCKNRYDVEQKYNHYKSNKDDFFKL